MAVEDPPQPVAVPALGDQLLQQGVARILEHLVFHGVRSALLTLDQVGVGIDYTSRDPVGGLVLGSR